jgi:hypothetical protein
MMRVMARPLIAALAVGFVATGCATPLPVIRLSPRSPDAIWVAGRSVLTYQQGGVRAAAAFDHQDGETVAFRVEVENDSADRLEVDPKAIWFVTCTTESECSPGQRVVDPEDRLLALDEQRSNQQVQTANSQTASAVLVFLSATADIAAAARGHVRDVGQSTAAAASVSEASGQSGERALAHIDSERLTWSTAALRRTTLFSGHGAAGFVFLPVVPSAKYVWLNVPVSGHPFWFSFDQTVFAPAKRTESESAFDENRPALP